MDQYKDIPYKGNDFIETLNGIELQFFIQGYLHACIHIKDLIGKVRTKFLTAALDEEDGLQKRLLQHVRVLDTLEESVSSRERILHSLAEKS